MIALLKSRASSARNHTTSPDAPLPTKDARKEKELAWYSSISKRNNNLSASGNYHSTNNKNNNNNTTSSNSSFARQFLPSRNKNENANFESIVPTKSSMSSLQKSRLIKPKQRNTASSSIKRKSSIKQHHNHNHHHNNNNNNNNNNQNVELTNVKSQSHPVNPPRKLNLAERLQELSSAYKDGLIDDDEYRILRTEAFETHAATSGSGDILQDAGTLGSNSADRKNGNGLAGSSSLSRSGSRTNLETATTSASFSQRSSHSERSSVFSSAVNSFLRRGNSKSIKSASYKTSSTAHQRNQQNDRSSPIQENWQEITPAFSPDGQLDAAPVDMAETLSMTSMQTGNNNYRSSINDSNGRRANSIITSVKSSPNIGRSGSMSESSFFRSKMYKSSLFDRSFSEEEGTSSISFNSLSTSPRQSSSYNYDASLSTAASTTWSPRKIRTGGPTMTATPSSLNGHRHSTSITNNNPSLTSAASTMAAASTEDPWEHASSGTIRREIASIQEEHQRLLKSFEGLELKARTKLEDPAVYDNSDSTSNVPVSPSSSPLSSSSLLPPQPILSSMQSNSAPSTPTSPMFLSSPKSFTLSSSNEFSFSTPPSPLSATGGLSTPTSYSNKRGSISASLLSTPLTPMPSVPPQSESMSRSRSFMGLKRSKSNKRQQEKQQLEQLSPPSVQIRPPSYSGSTHDFSIPSHIDPEEAEAVFKEIENIRAKKRAVNERYQSRLEYLSARLDTALIRERLPR